MYGADGSCMNTVLVERGVATCSSPTQPAALVLPEDNEWDVFVSFVETACDVTVRIVHDQYSVSHD